MYKSITKSSYIEEGKKAIRLAKQVETKEELEEKLIINQNSEASRKTCWSQINKRYLKYEKNQIIKIPLLKLMDFYGEKLNNELMYYYYLQAEPTLKLVVLRLLYPRLKTEERFELRREDISYFLNDHLNYSKATEKKTARSIVKALLDFGIIKLENNRVIVEYYEPSIISFVYAFYAEYGEGFEEAREHNILNPSLDHISKKAHFPVLFLLRPGLIEPMLQMAWKKDYLNYEPRGGLNQYVLKFETGDKFSDYLLKGGNH